MVFRDQTFFKTQSLTLGFPVLGKSMGCALNCLGTLKNPTVKTPKHGFGKPNFWVPNLEDVGYWSIYSFLFLPTQYSSFFPLPYTAYSISPSYIFLFLFSSPIFLRVLNISNLLSVSPLFEILLDIKRPSAQGQGQDQDEAVSVIPSFWERI